MRQPRVTFPPRVNNIACYMAEHLTIDVLYHYHMDNNVYM